ncbi:MAG: hypothetical protein IJV17_04155 [Prevotella sp.]|nr:hypothetical protein [Prevotella sp.]
MKRSIILLCLIAMACLTISAQVKKRPAGNKPAAKSAPVKKTTTPATFAIVNMDSDVSLEKPLAEGPDALYFINQLGRSVLAIDKKTGNISQYLPGGRDKMITAIGHDGKDLYMMVTNVGLVRYDGKSRETSPCLFPTSDFGKGVIGHQHEFRGITFSPNKRWLVAYGTGALLFDMEGGQCKFVRQYDSNGIQNAFVFDDGGMLTITTSEIVAVPPTAGKDIRPYKEVEGGAKIYKVKSDIMATTVKDGTLYGCWNRFLAKTPLPWQDIKWELVYQLESEDNRFQNFAIGPKSIMAECEEYGQYYVEWSSSDFTGTPAIKAGLKTTIKHPVFGTPIEQKRNSDQLYYDQQGNLIMYGYSNLDIYNPDGIKGYTSLQNKTTKFNGE